MKPTGAGTPRLRNYQTVIGLGFALPSALILLAFIAYPAVNALRLSFFDVQLSLGTELFVGLRNYEELFRDANLGYVLKNTAVWTVASLAGQMVLGLIAALAINQPVPGVRFVRSILIMPYVVPVIALALVWRWMFDGSYGILSAGLQQAGLIASHQSPLATLEGAMPTVIAANIWRGFPFAMLVYWAALQGIDQEQYSAARVDGANLWQEFRFITLPNLAQATTVLLVLRAIWTVTYFDLIWLITQGGPAGATEHWPIWIFREAMGFFRFGYASAIGTLMGIVLLILVLVYVRVTRFGAEQ